MKKSRKICALILALSIVLCITGSRFKYGPSGAFYFKTSPAAGDMGESQVISLEAEQKTYTAEGDITVPMTVGLGHLPGKGFYGEFCVRYRILEQLVDKEIPPVWEKIVPHEEEWSSEKFNSTKQINFAILFIPYYVEFYPIYKETVEIIFPETVDRGYLEVALYPMEEDREQPSYCITMYIYFERADGVLTLDPRNIGAQMYG